MYGGTFSSSKIIFQNQHIVFLLPGHRNKLQHSSLAKCIRKKSSSRVTKINPKLQSSHAYGNNNKNTCRRYTTLNSIMLYFTDRAQNTTDYSWLQTQALTRVVLFNALHLSFRRTAQFFLSYGKREHNYPLNKHQPLKACFLPQQSLISEPG